MGACLVVDADLVHIPGHGGAGKGAVLVLALLVGHDVGHRSPQLAGSCTTSHMCQTVSEHVAAARNTMPRR